MKTNASGAAAGGQKQMIPEEFHPELLDQVAESLGRPETTEGQMAQLRAGREARAWAGVAKMAHDHPDEWDTVLTFLVDQARYFTDECATLAHETDDPQEGFGKVKTRAGCAFALFLAAKSLSPKTLAARANPRTGLRRGGNQTPM